ncbi:MAG: prepilin-type N-terminal cleavage/methylation domain-containing protein [bacterium]
MQRTTSMGFTLIELLIVVAIIGILAAIAVPNFMNARIRAKVSHSLSELRTYKDVQRMYRMDTGDIPGHYDGKEEHCPYVNLGYLSGPLTDPFMIDQPHHPYFVNHEGMYHSAKLSDPIFMQTYAPRLYQEWKAEGFGYFIYGEGPVCCGFPSVPYDSSNGLVSGGVIIRPGERGKGEPHDSGGQRTCK